MPSAAAISSAQSAASAVIPGATADLVPDDVTRGYLLKITVPSSAYTVPGTKESLAQATAVDGGQLSPDLDATTGAAVGWRAHLAAAVIAQGESDITRYAATSPASEMPLSDIAQNSLIGSLRGAPGDAIEPARPRLGTISQAAALAQESANLKAITAALPDGAVESSAVGVVDVAPADGLFALQITLQVKDLSALGDDYGDLLNGPSNGLAGGAGAGIEGIAVVISDDRGQHLGTWRTERGVTGITTRSPSLALPAAMALHATYTNSAGGPPAVELLNSINAKRQIPVS